MPPRRLPGPLVLQSSCRPPPPLPPLLRTSALLFPCPHLASAAACCQSVRAVIRVLSRPAQLFPIPALVLLLLPLGSWIPWAQGTASLIRVSNAYKLRLAHLRLSGLLRAAASKPRTGSDHSNTGSRALAIGFPDCWAAEPPAQ
ncbi:hypothetical protein NDU88_003421 [Pleurodeles waltl]|uniref:Uncharacterized protein n=1 Tax=Pleurodeles waltl TaxID=8319 RepID=A0AAV7NJU6_PLEWA|nr:hypothetical protein NDU88_003421 [Pleurodeles waltl]